MKKIYLLLSGLLLAAHPVSAQFSNALHFDGANDYVNASLPGIFNTLSVQDFTIEAWIKPDNFIFSRIMFAQSAANSYTSLAIDNGGHLFFYVVAGGQYHSAQSIPAVTLNQWSHVAVTWSATTTDLQVYIDGVAVSTTAGGTSSTGTNNSLSIGARPDGAQYFNGAIDELRIWDTVRTGYQIAVGKNHELTLPQAGLVSYYKFNQGIANGSNPTVTTLNDALNANNGTLNNFTLSGTTSNWVANTLTLPLDWLSVKAMLNAAQQTELTWKVQEQRVAGYTVEKSTDARNFNAIASVTGKGDGIHEYSYTDVAPQEGTSYYRLKQTDEDGRYTYSTIVRTDAATGPAGIKVYPNPASGQLNVSTGNQKGNFTIYDGRGRLLFSAAATGNEPLHIDISTWQPGLYFYSIGGSKGSFIKKK